MASKKAKKIFLITTGVIIILLFLAIVVFRINQYFSSSSTRGPVVPVIQLSNPTTGNIEVKLSYTGDILPVQQANIYSRVNGNIKKIYHDAGDYVSKGTLLAVIDNSSYIQATKQTRAALNQAKATYENNESNLSRVKQLLEKGLAPQSEFDNAVTALKLSSEQIASADANYNNSLLNLEYCYIRAPFSGYITKKFLEVGSLVAANSQSTSNILFTISDFSSVKVMVNVPEKDLPLLDISDEADITTASNPNEVFKGKIKKFTQSVDLSTRTMPAEINISNKDGKLKPGMFANIDILIESKENVLMIPNECVLKDSKGSFVFTVSQDTLAVKVYIEIGYEQDNKYEIKSGLTSTDKIISTGQQIVKEGGKVKF